MSFKVGDRVRCNDPGWRFITKDKEYGVIRLSSVPGYVFVADNLGHNTDYPESTFDLVITPAPAAPAFKVGDYVVRARNPQPALLTPGRAYEVRSVSESNNYLNVECDNGVRLWFSVVNFDLFTYLAQPPLVVAKARIVPGAINAMKITGKIVAVDVEEERCRAVLTAAPKGCCKCGIPAGQCIYHP